jgi:hypothetical protein
VLILNQFVLSQVWSLVGEEARVSAAKETSTAVVIDITKHGYFKLLGKGQLPAQPVVVRAKFVSKLAEKKIKEVRWETALLEEAMQGRLSSSWRSLYVGPAVLRVIEHDRVSNIMTSCLMNASRDLWRAVS